jgi:hypothetical protein
MNPSCSSRATSLATFFLALLLTLIAARPARAAEPFRLDRVGVVQFTAAGEGKLRRHSGVLYQSGQVTWRLSTEVARPGNTPESALGCTLITNAAWLSYPAVGFNALDNFELTDGMVRIAIGEGSFHFIAPNPLGYLATGRVINISTRARVAAGGDEVIAGFDETIVVE